MREKLKLIIICIILLSVVPVTLSLFVFALPTQYDDTFLGELKYKYELIKQTEGKRIIIIGGSNVAFGQYSDLIESELPDDYTVINFGMYGGLGSTVMLDLAEPYIHEGDIIIFSPEQTSQTLSMHFDSESMWIAADGAFSMLGDLSKGNLNAMIGEFTYFAAMKFNDYTSGNSHLLEGVYTKEAFNQYGDIDYVARTNNIMSEGYDVNTPISFSTDIISSEFISYVNDFASSCESKGAAVYYRFCPMNEDAVTISESDEIDEYYSYLQNLLEFEIIGDPYTSILEKEWFYDTNFHLNSSGAILNTIAITTEIKQILNDDSPVTLDIPDMPELASNSLTIGNNQDKDYFVYEESDDKLYIIGLTQEGLQKESLIIPAEYNGLPVTSFSANVFSGNTIIKEITLQSNISYIENGSFEGCSALKRLIIDNINPETCSVSEDLLAGTECNIYVPQESIFSYMTNYFWSIHADRIYSGDDEYFSIKEDYDVEESQISDEPDTAEEYITYMANGGYLIEDTESTYINVAQTTGHMRVNTALGTKLFEREGYVLTGWNTQADGSGEHIGFGSRTEKKEGLVLYAQWAKATDESDFLYEEVDGEIYITKYLGNSSVCTVPETIDGLSVHKILSYAFEGAQIDTLVLPPSVFSIERYAFADSTVREIYLYDTLYYVYDESFERCSNLTTMHINAATKPVYSGSYYDVFSDRYDWLYSIKDEKKIVLFSGSSGRYGYDSEAIMEAFPEYQVANMGIYAYTNALPQLMIIKTMMNENDILISAPEFDTINNQFCTTNALDSRLFNMMESNYDAFSLLDLKDYTSVFDSFCEYLTTRSVMSARNYSISPSRFDDDGNEYDYPTYNQYGDFVLERPNGENDELLQTLLADYTTDAFTPETIQCINNVYEQFLQDGIKVYFTYAPRNQSSLTLESVESERQELDEYLKENLCVPVISNIEDYIYSGIYFYLIDNHLSTEGVKIRTAHIIEDLKNQLVNE